MLKLWGTRFSKKPNKLAEKFTSSISFDKELAKYDILGSLAHIKMLSKRKIISTEEAEKIIKSLNSILKDLKKEKLEFSEDSEDIHSYIQNLLFERIGEVAHKLHTARSRNDQIVLDVKMYLKDKIDKLVNLIRALQLSILNLANKNFNVIIPAYTHLQKAQCVLLAHYLLAYIEELERDKLRLLDAKFRLDEMPLGSCALAGTGLNIDRDQVRKILGFRKVSDNSIDSVSDRDFILEVLADLVILAVHFSRIAEDLILWSTKEFNFIDIDFSFCTGSSIMPHKKNPDVLELIRAYSGKIFGSLSNLVLVLKGLPFTYNRDLQLDKPALFEAILTVEDILKIFKELFKNIKINKEVISKHLEDEALYSVDLVEYLIKNGFSYREAHDLVGRMVRECLDRGKKISELSEKELQKYSLKLSSDIKKLFSPWNSIKSKISYGSTNPYLVKKQLNRWTKKLNA